MANIRTKFRTSRSFHLRVSYGYMHARTGQRPIPQASRTV